MTKNFNCPNSKIPIKFVVDITLIFHGLETEHLLIDITGGFSWAGQGLAASCISWGFAQLSELFKLQFTLRPAFCTQWYFATSEHTDLLYKQRGSWSDRQIPPYLLVITSIHLR